MFSYFATFQPLSQNMTPPKTKIQFQAIVNGNIYQPTVAVDNKKDAKANAAWYALQEMGFIQKDLADPL